MGGGWADTGAEGGNEGGVRGDWVRRERREERGRRGGDYFTVGAVPVT